VQVQGSADRQHVAALVGRAEPVIAQHRAEGRRLGLGAALDWRQRLVLLVRVGFRGGLAVRVALIRHHRVAADHRVRHRHPGQPLLLVQLQVIQQAP